MLSVTGLNRLYYLRDFHDMRCKYDRVRSVIHRQLDREPEEGDVFIMMSKDRRLVRLYSYDRRSCSLYKKRFKAGYRLRTWIGKRNYRYYGRQDSLRRMKMPLGPLMIHTPR